MEEEVLKILKARLNRLDDLLDDYLRERITAAVERLAESGIYIQDTVRDRVFLVDVVAWDYSNRDKQEAEPQWLRDEKLNRFLHEGGDR